MYTGRFEGGRPAGEGTFAFHSGITQSGRFEVRVSTARHFGVGALGEPTGTNPFSYVAHVAAG